MATKKASAKSRPAKKTKRKAAKKAVKRVKRKSAAPAKKRAAKRRAGSANQVVHTVSVGSLAQLRKALGISRETTKAVEEALADRTLSQRHASH